MARRWSTRRPRTSIATRRPTPCLYSRHLQARHSHSLPSRTLTSSTNTPKSHLALVLEPCVTRRPPRTSNLSICVVQSSSSPERWLSPACTQSSTFAQFQISVYRRHSHQSDATRAIDVCSTTKILSLSLFPRIRIRMATPTNICTLCIASIFSLTKYPRLRISHRTWARNTRYFDRALTHQGCLARPIANRTTS